MTTLLNLFNLATGRPLPEEEEGPARKLQVMMLACLVSVIFAALFGLAAGSSSAMLAMSNLYKLPMVVLLSALSAVPAGLLTWKLVGSPHRADDLLMGHVAGNFTATLVLAAAAPIVALYYQTSGHYGGAIALAACGLAAFLGLLTTARSIFHRVPREARMLVVALPVGVLAVVQLSALMQFITVASPILPEHTALDGGIDEIAER